MGLISGDVNLVTVGRDLKTAAPVSIYDARGGNVIQTVPAGTDLGICTSAYDGTTFLFGYWWLSFPASATIPQAYWVQYDPSLIVNGDGTAIVSDASSLLPTPVSNAIGSIGNSITNVLSQIGIDAAWAVGILVLLLIIYLCFRFIKK